MVTGNIIKCSDKEKDELNEEIIKEAKMLIRLTKKKKIYEKQKKIVRWKEWEKEKTKEKDNQERKKKKKEKKNKKQKQKKIMNGSPFITNYISIFN